jgi:hypothetical protein
VSFDPPAPPFLRSDTGEPSSIAHFADPATRAGIHLLAYASDGPTSGDEPLRARALAYERGLENSVAGLLLLGRRSITRFGLQGYELEYEGGADPRMHMIDWVLYARGRVYVVQVSAPAQRFTDLAAPLLRSRATLRVDSRQ